MLHKNLRVWLLASVFVLLKNLNRLRFLMQRLQSDIAMRLLQEFPHGPHGKFFFGVDMVKDSLSVRIRLAQRHVALLPFEGRKSETGVSAMLDLKPDWLRAFVESLEVHLLTAARIKLTRFVPRLVDDDGLDTL